MRKRCLVLLAAVVALCSASALASPTLDTGLYVLGTEDAVTYSGWPLLFDVSFANQGAYNDSLRNLTIEAQLAEIEELVASGDITESEAEEMRKSLVLREIEPVVLGAVSLPWTELVSFESSGEMLLWEIERLAEDVPATLVLDGSGSASFWYGLDAEASDAVTPGVYEISVVVSTDGVAGVPDGVWMGTSGSLPVRVEIRDEPELTDDVRVRKWIVFGQDAFYRERFEIAESHLLDAVALDPRSVEAWALLGETQYALEKLEDALGSFRQALDLSMESPAVLHRDEPPAYLIDRILLLQEELG